MVMATICLSFSWYVFQERLDAVIKKMTGIADDVLAKGDSTMNHDLSVFSLLEAVQNNNLKFNPD